MKQEIYDGLYSDVHYTSLKDLIFPSPKHTGSVRLFTKFKTDFFILKIEEDCEECNIWKQKDFDCAQLNSKMWLSEIRGTYKYTLKSRAYLFINE